MAAVKDKKAKLIEQILKITKSDGTVYFDQLSDKSEEYLTKLLEICKAIR